VKMTGLPDVFIYNYSGRLHHRNWKHRPAFETGMGRKRKHSGGKYDRVNLVGVTLGGSTPGVILSEEYDTYGHRYVMVQWFCNPTLNTVDRDCPACHGKPKRHRWDKIKRGEVKSCGRLKKQRHRDYLQRKTKHPDYDVNGVPIPANARRKTR